MASTPREVQSLVRLKDEYSVLYEDGLWIVEEIGEALLELAAAFDVECTCTIYNEGFRTNRRRELDASRDRSSIFTADPRWVDPDELTELLATWAPHLRASTLENRRSASSEVPEPTGN